MFKPAKIYHTTILIDEGNVGPLINELYELGLCELKEAEAELDSKYSYELMKNLDNLQTRFDNVIGVLEDYEEVVEPGKRFKNLILVLVNSSRSLLV